MKRCPECRRDYYDDTLLYCLDDGNALLEGPASVDEPATAILSVPPAISGGLTGAKDETDVKTAILQPPATAGGSDSARGFDKRLILAPLALTVIVLGGFFAYKYFAPTKQIESIAVLPFENRSGNAGTDYLSDGLTDSLIFRFSQLPNIKVSPTSSVMRYKGKQTDVAEIAKELEVDAVLSGRLMQIGDSLNINVQLIDARSKKLIWAEQYDRKMADLLATQREIAITLTEKMQLRLAVDERGITKKYTNSNEAYQLYLKGRFHWAKRTKDDLFKAIDSFKQAIDIDPNFALAYVGIAEAYNSMGKNPDLAPAETIPKAKAAAIKALEIDPSLAQAHSALGDSLALYDWNWAESEREFNRALELDPNIAYIHLVYSGTFLSAAGRVDEAVREAERAVELEPLSLINNSVLASAYILNRQYDKGLVQARKTYELDPNFPLTRLWLGISQSIDGKHDEAIALVKDISSQSPLRVNALCITAFAHAKAGRRAEAEQIITEVKNISKTQYVRPYYIAWVYAALGDKDKAMVELQRSFDERDCYLPRARVDPLLDPLRDDPRFQGMMKRMGLPQ